MHPLNVHLVSDMRLLGVTDPSAGWGRREGRRGQWAGLEGGGSKREGEVVGRREGGDSGWDGMGRVGVAMCVGGCVRGGMGCVCVFVRVYV